ncbi:LysM peptidoglycan-binding domain-containing protein [Lysobacter solisilvae (ex Woo and Kim 2020)]|uniref:LysM peptidoglycan-binding domain-containing protein n=1 Tax=Agrilutibacter terrestris TaxID=2865112 RepID=A0A7H0G1J3_9GAMM|nr:LysM peptidoglycan-binding domain-containing protein [Lysobacter terrestris]QNP42159.1 LysM peptidoglycan-binding domain-containing protein [Lysobacter terrestris]
MLKPIRTVITAAFLTIATVSVAQEMRGDHPDTYTVRRGDTLWDIAGKFLKRPWLWPEIWQANPQIKNPHLIYPGDVISLAYLDRVAVTQGPRDEAPLTGVPLKDVEPFLKNLRVVDEFEDLPYVVGLEEDRLRASLDQVAYVRGLADAQPGQRYAIVRPTVRYNAINPKRCCDVTTTKPEDLDFRGRTTKFTEQLWNHQMPASKGEFLGYELMQLTTATVSRGPGGQSDAATLVLDQSGREVRVGDRLIAVEAQPYDLQFFPHPPKQEFAYGKAKVLAVADMISTGGPRDVVALSVGARDGVDNGTVFSGWRVGSTTPDRVAVGDDRSPDAPGSKVRLPDEFSGHMMVFRTFDKVSYALVMDSIRPTRVGYELKHPDASN